MMNEEAIKSCLSWEGIDHRMLVVHFMTVHGISHINIHAPIQLTYGDRSDSDKSYYRYRME